MAFAGLQILVFHLWISVTGSTTELFLQKTAFVGVDIFFLLSGWSLGSREIEDVKAFLKGRFQSVYVKFFLLSLLAYFVGGWTNEKFLSTVTGVSFFQKGGGSFLWFVPAVLLVYLFAPLLQKGCRANTFFMAAAGFLVWFIAGYMAGRLTNYTALYIFWNRIPVILTGFFLGRSEKTNDFFENTKTRVVLGLILTAAGLLLARQFAYTFRLQKPFPDFFYVTVLPLALGLAFLVSLIPENKIIRLLGNATLEMYGLQMIIGYKAAGRIFKATGNAMLTNICSVVLIGTLSVLLSLLFQKATAFRKEEQK